jgi:hypothetical protein
MGVLVKTKFSHALKKLERLCESLAKSKDWKGNNLKFWEQ